MTRIHRRTATGNALALSACLLMTLMTFVRPAASADGTDAGRQAIVRFDLPAQPLDAALVAFGEMTGYSVLVSSQLAAGRVAAPVRGGVSTVRARSRPHECHECHQCHQQAGGQGIALCGAAVA